MFTVTITETIQQRMPGDRASHTVDSSTWEIKINDFVVQEFSQYDGWHCSVGNHADALNEVRKYVDGFCAALGIPVPMVIRQVEKEVPAQTVIEIIEHVEL